MEVSILVRDTANPIPALTSPQTPATEMTLLSELPHQDRLEPAPTLSPNPLQNVPLAPITNFCQGKPPWLRSP